MAIHDTRVVLELHKTLTGFLIELTDVDGEPPTTNPIQRLKLNRVIDGNLVPIKINRQLDAELIEFILNYIEASED